MKFEIFTALVIFLPTAWCQSQSITWGGGVDHHGDQPVSQVSLVEAKTETASPRIPAAASIALLSIATSAGFIRRKGVYGGAESMDSPLRIDRETYTQDLA